MAIVHISQEDLLSFHLFRYEKPFIATASDVQSYSHPIQTQSLKEDEDDLGYYPDGVKRTLTDEQIAIFRHSEIQALLRDKRHREEKRLAELDEVTAPEGSKGGLPSGELDERQYSADMKDFNEGEEESEVKETEDNDDEEYARFLEAERRQFQMEATSNRMSKRAEAMRGPDRTTSTRRRVRELDAVVGGEDILDYGDEPTISSKREDSNTTIDIQVEGRKIWWPIIQA